MTMVFSDIAADGNRCRNCGRLLSKHYGGKTTRELLRLWDNDVVFAIVVDVTCAFCGAVNEIFYQADMLPTVATNRGRFAWAPAV